MIKTLAKYKGFIFPLLLVFFFISEGLNKAFFFQDGKTLIVAKLLKGALLCFIFMYILVLKKGGKHLFKISLILFMFCVGQFFLPLGFNTLVLENCLKYIFLLSILLFYNTFFKSTDSKILLSVFEILIAFNSILIIIGYVFDIFIFKTYTGLRFGYNGLLVSSATSTYVYTIALLHFLLKFKQTFPFRFIVCLSAVAALLVGTKSLYFVLLCVLAYYLYYYCFHNYKRVFLFIVTLFSFLLFYFIFFKIEVFSSIREKHGLIASVVSYRNIILEDKMLPFISDNWKLINYLFGGISDISTRPQMMLLDLFYFFGAIGGIFYLLLFQSLYFNFKLKKLNIFFFSLLFFIAIIGGNFFLNATIVIYLIVIKESTKKYNKY